ncbi:hypothetical protein FQR65_LT17651 [Abscondita terminalis]|nr:hypothetical protein FQR65_LT17651 [Abscondita terminalis]
MAKAEAEAAIAAGVMTANDENALLLKALAGNDTNGLSQVAAWNEFAMSSTIASYLKGYEDPRLSIYFQPQKSYFLRSEGALNGWNMGGTAQELYEQGIKLSLRQWGVTDATLINTDYLPDGLTHLEESDVLAAVAPRALKMLTAIQDGNAAFAPLQMLKTYNRSQVVSTKSNWRMNCLIPDMINNTDIAEEYANWFDTHLNPIVQNSRTLRFSPLVLFDDLIRIQRG